MLLKMLRDMLRDVGAKKLMNESSPLKAVDSPGYCVVSGCCCPTAGSVHAACNMLHEVSPQQLLYKKAPQHCVMGPVEP